ncbi:MAG: GntR family transcriptional regulator [Betaproteobacteria bacterium]|nr:GntR family transcriptional regulator [Betaproteobacteria bacterium]
MSAMPNRMLAEPLTPTLPLQIAERIGGGIIDETFPPGERLKETGLAQTFGVSRATIRESLRILENRGLVSIVPQRGAQVTKLSRKELEDLFEIRAVLLGLVSRRVALSCTPEVERLLFAGFRALQAARNGATAYARASADLVAVLARSSGNQQLLDYITSFAQRIGRYSRLGLTTPGRRKKSLANWRKLIRAIVARDGDTAEAMHRRLSMQNLAAGLVELDRREREERAARERERRPRA